MSSQINNNVRTPGESRTTNTNTNPFTDTAYAASSSSSSNSNPPSSLIISPGQDEEEDFFADPPHIIAKSLARQQAALAPQTETTQVVEPAHIHVPTPAEHEEILSTLSQDPCFITERQILRVQRGLFAWDDAEGFTNPFSSPILSEKRGSEGEGEGEGEDEDGSPGRPKYDGAGWGHSLLSGSIIDQEAQLASLFADVERGSWTYGDDEESLTVMRGAENASSSSRNDSLDSGGPFDPEGHMRRNINSAVIELPGGVNELLVEGMFQLHEVPARREEREVSTGRVLRRAHGYENLITSQLSVNEILDAATHILNSLLNDSFGPHINSLTESNNSSSSNLLDNVFADMDVKALVDDHQNTTRQFVDNDHLRGDCRQDIEPHPWRLWCECYHCNRVTLGAEDDDPHDLSYCSCAKCYIIRNKIEDAEEKRAQEKEEKIWAKRLASRLKPNFDNYEDEELEDDVLDLMIPDADEDEDQENIFGAFI